MDFRSLLLAVAVLLTASPPVDARPKRAKQVKRVKRPKAAKPPAPAPTPTPAPAPTPIPAADAAPPVDAPKPSAPTDDPPAPTAPASKRPSDAARGPRKTTEAVVLRKRPGETTPAVKKLAAGTVVVVIGEEGRWLRVRAGKAVGYLTRTTVSAGAVRSEADIARWGASRRIDVTAEDPLAAAPTTTGLVVDVSAETSPLRAEPTPEGTVVSAVARGQRLAVIEGPRTAGWLHARDEKGNEGWIQQEHVADGSASVAMTGVETDDVASESTPVSAATTVTPRKQQKLAIRADAGIGYRSLGWDFTSNGSAELANYLVSADATALDLGIDVVSRLSKKLHVGFDGRLQLSRSSPGIDYNGPMPDEIPFSTFSTDAGARAGLKVKEIFELAVRGGFHYDAFLATGVEKGMLPRESLIGGTLGLRAEIAPPRSRVAVTGRFDALVLGSRRQTPGLEDGASSTARAFYGGVVIRVQLARHFSLLSAYDFGRATTRWSGVSVRDPGATNAQRVDSTQLVQLGLSTDF